MTNNETEIQLYLNWIEEGNPVYGIYGWSWKGASYYTMSIEQAVSEIKNGKPFEVKWRIVEGENALVLQYVGENDLY